MNVTDPELVIVRGINSDWLETNFSEMRIGFNCAPRGIPAQDAFYIGLYIGAPVSAITHIGIVDRIDRNNEDELDVYFYLKAIIKLKEPKLTDHQIRSHVYLHLSDFGMNEKQMRNLREQLSAF